MRFTTRIGIMLISSSLVLSGCSDHHDLSLNSPAQQNRSKRLLDPRTNPLQDYIQTNWTSSVVGGTHYENIKIYGHSYQNLDGYPTDADFIANHFDIYMGGGEIVGDAAESENPGMLWLGEAANIPHVRNGWELDMVDDFLTNANPNNYTFDDLVLHYAINTIVGVDTTLGWNPADDNDHDGHIETGEGLNHDGQPSDANRSALNLADSRVHAGGPSDWHIANPSSQAYIDFRAWMAQWHWDTLHVEGFHFDEASYQDDAFERDRTIEYWGLAETSSPYYYVEDKYQFVPAAMSEAEDLIGEGPLVAFANVVSGEYLCGAPGAAWYIAAQHNFAQDNLENIFLETWMPTWASVDTTKIDRMLKCPFEDFLEQGKGVVFTYRQDNSSGRLFSLSLFYMINHQMAFYYYTKQDHNGIGAEAGQWNPWVEYNVGQPMVNDLGKNDVWGNANTDKFFVMQTDHSTYTVLGRMYTRVDDDAIILVLAKVMAPGQTEGQVSTSVSLLGTNYRVVQSNFSLSSGVGSVSLTNNQGIILIRANTGNGSGGCHCTPQG